MPRQLQLSYQYGTSKWANNVATFKKFSFVIYVFFSLQFDMKKDGTFLTRPSQRVLVCDIWSYMYFILNSFLNNYTSYYKTTILNSYILHTVVLSYQSSYYNTVVLNNHPSFG